MFIQNIFIAFILLFFVTAENKYKTNLTLLNSDEYLIERSPNGIRFNSTLAKGKSAKDFRDNGGNYGDLVYRYRENGDTLLLREVVIPEVLYSDQQDIRWTVSISGARISSVRVLNFGRERAYCLRIDVAGGDVQTILRIQSLQDPRVMIEVYGF